MRGLVSIFRVHSLKSIQFLHGQQLLRTFASRSSEGELFIDLFRQHGSRESFTNALGLLRTSVPRESIHYSDKDRELVARYSFPDHFTSPHRKDDSVDLSAVLAIFDEISTWALFAADLTRRPGVSVHLSAVAHWDRSRGNDTLERSTTLDACTAAPDGPPPPPRVCEELEVVTTVTQLGKTLGFLHCELRRRLDTGDEYGVGAGAKKVEGRDFEVLVTGKHVKFLPMPGQGPSGVLPWNAVFGRSRIFGSWFGKTLLRLTMPKEPKPPPPTHLEKAAATPLSSDEGSSLAEEEKKSGGYLVRWIASLTPLQGTNIEGGRNAGGGGGGATAPVASSPSSPSPSPPLLPERSVCKFLDLGFVTGREHCNGMGTTHGGMQAILAEAAGHRLLNADDESSQHLVSITANYLSPHRRGPLRVAAFSWSEGFSYKHAEENSCGRGMSSLGHAEVNLTDSRSGRPTCEVNLIFERQRHL